MLHAKSSEMLRSRFNIQDTELSSAEDMLISYPDPALFSAGFSAHQTNRKYQVTNSVSDGCARVKASLFSLGGETGFPFVSTMTLVHSVRYVLANIMTFPHLGGALAPTPDKSRTLSLFVWSSCPDLSSYKPPLLHEKFGVHAPGPRPSSVCRGTIS